MLTDLERAVLEHCRGPEGAPLAPLRSRFKKTPLYDAVNELGDRGYLETPHRGRRRTTPAGERTLDEPCVEKADPIATLWPPFATLPHDVYKSIARLTILAAFLRTRGIASAHLPFFLIAGPTLSGKSTFGKMMCHAFGIPPERGVILTTAEAGKSIGVRRTATGAVGTIRDALALPLAVFDEVHRCPPEVRRALLPYLAGETKVAYENEALNIVATTIVLLNPIVAKEAGLEKRTGFDETLLRRSVPADLEVVPLPPAWRMEGERALEAAARAGPLRFPEPTANVRIAREVVVHAIDRIVRPECTKRVDVELVYGLCVAADMLGAADPVTFGVTNYATIVETVGWMRDGWRDSLRREAKPSPAQVSGFEPSPLGREVLAMAGDAERIAFEARAAAFFRACEALGEPPETVLDRVRRAQSREARGVTDAVVDELVTELEASGSDVAATAALVQDAVASYGGLRNGVAKLRVSKKVFERERDAIAQQIQKLGGRGRVDAASRALPLLDRLALKPADAETFLVSFAAEAGKRGLDPASAAADAVNLVRIHGRGVDEEAAHREAILKLTSQEKELSERVRAAKREAEAWESRAKGEAERAAKLRDEGARLAAEHGAARAQFAAGEEGAKARLAARRQEVDSLLARAGEDLRRIRGDAASVQEALRREREREETAEVTVRAYEDRAKALDERDAALRAREETLIGKEEAVEVGEVATALLWDVEGPHGEDGARRLEYLARCARSGKPPKRRYEDLRQEAVRNHLLYLAKPWIEKGYVARAERDRLMRESDGVKAQLEKATAHREAEKQGYQEETRRLVEELGKAKKAIGTYDTWFGDPGKLTPAQAEFVRTRYGQIFGDQVHRTVYVRFGASHPELACLACHDYFPATLPGVPELFAAKDGVRYEYVHDACGRKNAYEPRVLLAVQGLAMPVAIREAFDG